MPVGDSKTQVLIELKLEVKKLKEQMKDFMGTMKDTQKLIEDMGKKNEKAFKRQTAAIEELTAAAKKTADIISKGEKQKQEAIKKTGTELEKQKKQAQELGKELEKTKKQGFWGGLAAGAGIGGLRQQMGRREVGGLLGRGLSRGVGSLIGFLTSGMTQTHQQYMQYGQARGGLVGLGTPGQMRGAARAGTRLGYGPIETMLQARGIGRATGNIGAITTAQQAARAYGMDVGEAGGYMGMIRQAGFGFGGQVRGPRGQMRAVGREGNREFAKIIEAGMISGLEKGRIGEFLQGVSSITGNLGSQLPGKINISGIAAQAAMLGQSKLPGFQGARGMQMLGRLNQAIQAPGGGEAGQAMVLQALGFGKPGGGTRYYEALRTQEQGLNDPRNLPKIMNEVYSQLGDPSKGGRSVVNEEANIALKEMTGLSLRSVEELQTLKASGATSTELQKEIEKKMKDAEPIDKQALKEMKGGFGGIIKYTAGIEAGQIKIGAKNAGFFMKIQEILLKVLDTLTDWLPVIGEWLKEMYANLTISAQWAMKQLGLGTSIADYQKLMRERSADLEKYQVTGREGTVGKRIDILQSQKASLAKTMADIMDQFKTGKLTPLTQTGEKAQDRIDEIKAEITKINFELEAVREARHRLGVSPTEKVSKTEMAYVRAVAAEVKGEIVGKDKMDILLKEAIKARMNRREEAKNPGSTLARKAKAAEEEAEEQYSKVTRKTRGARINVSVTPEGKVAGATGKAPSTRR